MDSPYRVSDHIAEQLRAAFGQHSPQNEGVIWDVWVGLIPPPGPGMQPAPAGFLITSMPGALLGQRNTNVTPFPLFEQIDFSMMVVNVLEGLRNQRSASLGAKLTMP